MHNVHSKGQGLFDALMSWIELFLNYARDGLTPIDLEFLLPHESPERMRILSEVDAVAQYHYRLKVAHEEKVRRRFQTQPGDGGSSAEEAALLESVMASLSLSETAVAEGGEIDDEEEEDEEEDEDEAEEGGEFEEPSIKSPQPVPPESLHPVTISPPPGSTWKKDVKKERQGSDASARSFDVFKARRRSEGAHTAQGQASPIPGGSQLKRVPSPLLLVPGEKKSSRSQRFDEGQTRVSPNLRPQRPPKKKKAKARRNEQEMVAPPTKAIDELRPLFVEIVSSIIRNGIDEQIRPLLVVQPLQP